VHAECFARNPGLYLTALWSRVRRLRVRSRFQFAQLAGHAPSAYALWIARRELGDAPPIAELQGPPMRPVVMSADDPSALRETIRSLEQAGWQASEVTVLGPIHGEKAVRALGGWAELDPAGLDGAEWLMPVIAGDRIARGARAAYARAVRATPGAMLVYADDDLIDERGRRSAPHFKPDWNAELFDVHDVLSGACVIRAGLLPAEGLEELIARATSDEGEPPLHLPLVLHHRRHRPEPRIDRLPPRPALDRHPSVTAVIPTRNKANLLRTCLAGLRNTGYPDLEVIIVDNGSDEPEALALLRQCGDEGCRVLRRPGPFNYSALNNAAAREARGELLLLLNNDVEMTGDLSWLAWLAFWAMREDIGAVGARLLYPDGTVQHAGVMVGMGNGAGHAHRFLAADDPGYFGRTRLPQRVTAVTAACLMVARDKFMAVGGLDEVDFAVAFNDVDLCLKLNARGWQSFYEPRATLIHHESKSRGSDTSPLNRERFAGELVALQRKWRTEHYQDPFHNPNLSRYSEQFVIGM
jgi:GT2 family glycosyltransferase